MKFFLHYFYKKMPNVLKIKLRKFKIRKILSYHGNSPNSEEKIAITNLLNDGLRMIPYDFTKKYVQDHEICQDKDGYSFVKFLKHRVFFPKNLSPNMIKTKFNALLCEQDIESPHKYFTSDFKPNSRDYFYDIGSAEAIISLSVAEKVKKNYIFEYDAKWFTPLKKTFEKFGDKVVIINKFVSDKTSTNTVKISDYISDLHNDYFFKIDVEGEELNVLKGMENILDKNMNIKIAVCTYHNGKDFQRVVEYLNNKNFNIQHSKGYMIFDLETAPYLRRGVVRAAKKFESKGVSLEKNKL
jgi:hypothetical protein